MGKMFGNLTTDELETPTDRVGGGGFQAKPTDVYDAVIKLAYVGEASQSKAQSVTLHVEIDGSEMRETVWITNREGQNFSADKNDKKKKVPLRGFTTINDLCLFITGEELSAQETETKTAKLYDFDQRAEINKEVECLAALHGGKVKLGVVRKVENKRKKGDDGQYHDTAETRTLNTIDKVFDAETSLTVLETMREMDEPAFMEEWISTRRNQDWDATTGVSKDGGGAGGAGSGRPDRPKKKLFGKKA